MDHFEIYSKTYYSQKKKESVVLLLINIAVTLIALGLIGSIVIGDVSARNIIWCFVAMIIAVGLRKKNRTGGYYKECTLSIIIEKHVMRIDYLPDYFRQVIVDLKNVDSLEYSDKLQCLRLVGNITEKSKSKVTHSEKSELLLYITYEQNKRFYEILEKNTGIKMIFMDR